MGATPGFPFPPNPDGSENAGTRDMRAYFEALSRKSPRDSQAEQAFLELKLELIRNDPHLSEQQKEQAIDELRQRLKN